MQPQQGSGGGTGTSSTTTATGGRRRVSVRGAAAASVGSASVWEARMRMDEVKGGVKVFSAGAADEPADEEGMRVYRRLRRNQSDANAGAGTGTVAAAAKKRRNWKASEPVTAVGDLRKSRSDAAAMTATTMTTTTAVVERRAVARVTTPEKKVAPAAVAGVGEVKEVVVVEVHKAAPEEVEAKGVSEEPGEEDLDEGVDELDDEEEKEMLDQDHMVIDDDETAPHQGKESATAPHCPC